MDEETIHLLQRTISRFIISHNLSVSSSSMEEHHQHTVTMATESSAFQAISVTRSPMIGESSHQNPRAQMTMLGENSHQNPRVAQTRNFLQPPIHRPTSPIDLNFGLRTGPSPPLSLEEKQHRTYLQASEYKRRYEAQARHRLSHPPGFPTPIAPSYRVPPQAQIIRAPNVVVLSPQREPLSRPSSAFRPVQRSVEPPPVSPSSPFAHRTARVRQTPIQYTKRLKQRVGETSQSKERGPWNKQKGPTKAQIKTSLKLLLSPLSLIKWVKESLHSPLVLTCSVALKHVSYFLILLIELLTHLKVLIARP